MQFLHAKAPVFMRMKSGRARHTSTQLPRHCTSLLSKSSRSCFAILSTSFFFSKPCAAPSLGDDPNKLLLLASNSTRHSAQAGLAS